MPKVKTGRPVLPLRLDGLKASRVAFVKSYRRGARVLARDYQRLLEEAGEGEVHDARTATRRAEAHIDLLPKRIRTRRRNEELAQTYGVVLRRTARVRDMDVIVSKLSAEGKASATLVDGLRKRRKRAMKAAREDVLRARGIGLPPIALRDVSAPKLQRRFVKVVTKLAAEVGALAPRVVEDPSDVRGLHRLRIGCKKLRYLLEAVAAESEDVERLEAWQDALGSIHDWDVAIAYVKRVEPGNGVLERWTRQREREFRELAGSLPSGGRGARTAAGRRV